METPRLDSNLETGGPSVYLNNVLLDFKGLYYGLLTLPADCDVYLIYCLAMLAAACSRSMETQPRDKPDLLEKVRGIEEMMTRCISSRYMRQEHTFNDAFILSNQSCLEFLERNGSREPYDLKYFSSAFFVGPLAIAIECNLSNVLLEPHLNDKIDRYMYCCVREAGRKVCGYGASSALRARYCPAAMLLAEGVAKAALLSIVAVYSASLNSSGSSGSALTAAAILLLVVTHWIYEIGNMEEKRWAVSPSIVFDLKALERRRIASVAGHFFEDPWRFMDAASLCLLTGWAACYLIGSSHATLANQLLATACIPLSIGLLRYPSVLNAKFGTAVLATFLAAKSLVDYLLIYAATGLGFGLTFFTVFRRDLLEFQSAQRCLRTLFEAVLVSFDGSLFDDLRNGTFGLSISFLFLLWAVVVLFTCLLASIIFNFGALCEQAARWQVLFKCRQIQQFNMSLEKSPFCMLPPPLNLLPTVLYPFHVYYSWRDRFFIDRALSLSVAGVRPLDLPIYTVSLH